MKLYLPTIGIIALFIVITSSGCARAPVRIDTTPAPIHWRGGLNVNSALLEHFTRWQGVPHRLGGTDQSGIDCSAYVQRTYQELFNVALPRTAREQRTVGQAIKMSYLRAGDLLFFEGVFAPHHVGIYVGDGTFIHVSSTKGVVRTSVEDRYWRRYIKGARRVI